MSKANDPFYNRKQVPNEFIEHVGYTGLSPSQEIDGRERKFSLGGKGDLRKFSNPKYEGKLDPFYQRKQVPTHMIQDVAPSGLTKEEEFLNRERKYSVTGVDVRKFSDSSKSGWHPTDDPYYGRKAVAKPQIDGVGDTQMTRAEELEVRENKASLFDLSSDPFQQMTGSGHRASVSGMAGPAAAAAARRRSSAVAPDFHHHPETPPTHHQHSGYDGDRNLAAIPDQADRDEIRPSTDGPTSYTTGPTTTTTTTTTTATSVHPAPGGLHAGSTGLNTASNGVDPASNVQVRDNTGHAIGTTGHTTFYDAATRDLDNVGPHDRV